MTKQHANIYSTLGASNHADTARAEQRFPQQKVTLWAADALAIATYGLEQRRK